jgi:paraquat-inducible protein A
VSLEKNTTDKLLWLFALSLFILGISLPMFSLEKFIILKDSFSLLAGIIQLAKQGEIFLAIVILIFSVLVPLYKFLLLWKINHRPLVPDHQLSLVKNLIVIGKWSMADVFLIAILAATLKLGGLASVKAHIGLLFFAMSVITSMVLTHRLVSNYELKLADDN